MFGRTEHEQRFKHISKGFALIATITLMMLLALLSVGLLTIRCV